MFHWEERDPKTQLSPTSHHRGGYPTAGTVADRRVHLQNPLGHKRLQTFPCEESRSRTSEGVGGTRALSGRSQQQCPAPSRHEYEHPPQSKFKPATQPCLPRHPRGPRGDLQSSETGRSWRAPSPDQGQPLPPSCAPPPELHPLQAGLREPQEGPRKVEPERGAR